MKAWQQHLVLRVRYFFFKGYSLVQAWQEIPKLTITGMLEAVRDRVFSFALEMQQDIGNTDEALAKADPARVGQQVIKITLSPVQFVTWGRLVTLASSQEIQDPSQLP